MLEMKEWDGFEGRLWKEEINVRQFIQLCYTSRGAPHYPSVI